MSRVFVADELRLDRKVVVKVLSPDLAQGISVERFEREIRTAAALQQANIVGVLSAGDMDGLPFYTMPFVEGESLRAHLARGPMPIGDVVGILKDVSKALAYAHQRGVVHRDIKPDNVLLSGGTAVVTDFGIAKAITAARTQSGSATLTQIGTSIGTPAYMAPEQAAGDPDIDHRADIYSLGALAYELLTGQVLFAGRTPQRMLAAHMSEAPQPVATLRADVPIALADLVTRCLEKSPDARPQSAAEIVRALESMTSGSGMQALPPALLAGPGMFRRALAVYAAAFVAVALLAKAAIIVIGLPDWVYPGALVLMALGLPVILWTGYVHRVTHRAVTATPTYTPGGTPAMVPQGTMATMALRAAPHVSWYRTARGGAYALGVFVAVIAAFMLMRAFGIGPAGSLFARGQLTRRDPVILTDFRTTNTDTTLGRVVAEAVRAGLSGSTTFSLVPSAAIPGALTRMKLDPNTRVDASIAQQIALREGFKAVIDGEVTGVAGGYIVSVRLVRADSGLELASFRETGDGPRGLIDAADKLARALRAKAGESLRSVNASPPLFQATTSSLEALRKFSEAVRANALGDAHSIQLSREAIALDSTFASAWNSLAAELSNYGGSQSAIDSAVTRAYLLRDRLPAIERDAVTARYYSLGPGHDTQKAIAAYESILRRGDSIPPVLANLGEQYRRIREYAKAESLNMASRRLSPVPNGTSLGNIIEMQLNQGKIDSAAANVERLRAISQSYGISRDFVVRFARADYSGLHRMLDSLNRPDAPRRARQLAGGGVSALALLEGRVADFRRLGGGIGIIRDENAVDNGIYSGALELVVRGPTPGAKAALDAAVEAVPFRDIPLADRPYLLAARVLAFAGSPDKAQAMLTRFRTEVTDTALRRWREPEVHNVLGEIALAAGTPAEAITEFRRGDVTADGKPASECPICLPWNLARAFDAAGKADSAAAMYEAYVTTPYWERYLPEYDPMRLPAAHERLGQLYESLGKPDKAAEHYRAFIALWKNADPDLQPRVADAKRRLAKLAPVEQPKR
jgi:eukaryotic-like serine/threonine-protein kinase